MIIFRGTDKWGKLTAIQSYFTIYIQPLKLSILFLLLTNGSVSSSPLLSGYESDESDTECHFAVVLQKWFLSKLPMSYGSIIIIPTKATQF